MIKGYTEKQWGRKCTELPAFIIKRLPIRFVFDNNYFNDTYQGIPVGGYNKLIDGLLDGTETRTRVDFFADRTYWESMANTIVLLVRLMNIMIIGLASWSIARYASRKRSMIVLIIKVMPW